MADITINNLTPANTIDQALDFLPIYQNASGATLSINRNTLLNITTQPVGTDDIQTIQNKVFTNCSFSGAISNPVFSGTVTGTYTIGGTVTFPSNVTLTTAAQTLTNKTIDGAVINTSTINSPVLSGTITGSYTLSGSGSIGASVDVTEVLKKVYPVGAIYISTISTNPATVFGFGTWAAFAAGRTLVGVGTSDQAFTAGTTGGASNVTLATTQIPAHNHGVNDPGHNHSWSQTNTDAFVKNRPPGLGSLSWNGVGGQWVYDNVTGSITSNTTGISIQNTGGGQSHNNLQPYIVTYMWQRTA